MNYCERCGNMDAGTTHLCPMGGAYVQLGNVIPATATEMTGTMRFLGTCCPSCDTLTLRNAALQAAQLALVNRCAELEAERDAARLELANRLDHKYQTSCGHWWTIWHTACPVCFGAMRLETDALRQRLAGVEAERDRYRDTARVTVKAFVARVNARAEAEILAGRPITGAHHRAIEAELLAPDQTPRDTTGGT